MESSMRRARMASSSSRESSAVLKSCPKTKWTSRSSPHPSPLAADCCFVANSTCFALRQLWMIHRKCLQLLKIRLCLKRTVSWRFAPRNSARSRSGCEFLSDVTKMWTKSLVGKGVATHSLPVIAMGLFPHISQRASFSQLGGPVGSVSRRDPRTKLPHVRDSLELVIIRVEHRKSLRNTTPHRRICLTLIR